MSEFSVVCTKDNLLLGLSRAVPIAGRNTQLPILQHVLLQIKEGVLHITSTDLELGVHTTVGGKASGEGAITVPAKSILAYIQQLPPSNPVTLTLKKGALHVSTEGFSAQFPVSSAEDFPLLPRGKSKNPITLPAPMFCRALGQVVFAAARDETRPEIRGVHVGFQGGQLRFAATDSFRLAEDVVRYSGEDEISFILPLSSAQEVVRLFSGQEELSIEYRENYILTYSDEVSLSSRLIDGAYPDYQQIIPTKSSTVVKVAREELLRALKTLLVFLPRDSRRVELDINKDKATLVARVASGGVGEGVVDVPVEISGEGVKVLVNIQYILEGLQRLQDEECVIGVSGESSPLVIRPTKDADKYVYVVMPIRS